MKNLIKLWNRKMDNVKSEELSTYANSYLKFFEKVLEHE